MITKRKTILSAVIVMVLIASMTMFYAGEEKKGVTVEGLPDKAAQSIEKIVVNTDKDVVGDKVKVEVKQDSTSILSKEYSIGEDISLKNLKKDGKYKLIVSGEYRDSAKKFTFEKYFNIDNEKPTFDIKGVKDGTITNQDVTLSVKANDNVDVDVDKSSITLSGENIKGAALNRNLTISKEGRYDLKVVIVDAAGNEAKKDVSFTIDKTKPVINSKTADGAFVKKISDIEFTTDDTNIDKMELTFAKQNSSPITVNKEGNSISLKDEPSGDAIDEAWNITVKATDKAGNTEVKSMSVHKDNVAPKVEINGVEDGKFYNKDVNIKALVEDANISTKEMTVNGSAVSGLDQTITKEGEYDVSVKAVDKSGNETVKSIHFTIDKTPPVTIISGLTAKKHYQKPDMAKFSANEEAEIYYEVIADGKTIKEGKGDAFDGYTVDGDYTVKAWSIDRAGNVGEKASVSFVKDSTAPTVDLSGVSEGKYYNTNKGVSISVNERYYDTNKVSVTAYRERKGQKYNVPFSFKSNAVNSTNTLNATETGTYHVTVSAVDEAGNKSKSKSITFTVDKEKPVITINVKANNGSADAAAPEVVVKEDYMANKNIGIVKSFGDSSKEPSFSDSFTEQGGSRKYQGMPKKKAYDGVYTVKATVTDKAGNSATLSKTFTVNRFGSLFVVKEAPSKKYQKSVNKDVVIEEMNVGGINEYKAEVTLDDQTTEASNVTVSKTGYTTLYTVPKENFEREGVYRVNLVTRDAEGNTSESKKAKDGDIWFAVDKTAPIISYSGVESNHIYKKNSMKLYVNSRDTISKSVTEVRANGEVLDSHKDGNGTYVKLTKGINQKVEITATDKAGNEASKVLTDVTVSDSPFAYLLANKLIMFGLIILIAMIGGGAIYLAKKRKINKETGEDDLIF